MASSVAPAHPRRPPAVAWILLLAVLVGVAAALLARPVGSVAPAPPSLGKLTSAQVGEIVAVVIFVAVGLWVLLSLRDRGSRIALPSRVVATVLIMLLLGVLFVEFAGLVHISPLTTPTNGTGNPPPPGGSGNNVSTNSSGPPLGLPGVTLPGWAGIALLVGLALVAGALLVPYLVAVAEDRRRARDESVAEPSQEAQRALEQTLDRLRNGDGVDARAAILALYSRLLHLLGPRLGRLESRTPREIERDSVTNLGLQPKAAQDLTNTFEEARYSTHPMTPAAVDRARSALSEAISDLAKSSGAGR